MTGNQRPPVCDYEGSDYQTQFWEQGGREYEDGCEAIALKKLLPKNGQMLLELGAGAGRNTPRYAGFEHIVLLDYSKTQLLRAREKLGEDPRYIFVVANIYNLPFRNEIFDAATMIRVIHHMADPKSALMQIKKTLQPGAIFILEYANKRNLKAIARYLAHKQLWNPFSLDPFEFAPLNFDFHPKAVRKWLQDMQFIIESTITVSHFRIGCLKRIIPAQYLVLLDSMLQWSGAFLQLTPSVFIRSRLMGKIKQQEALKSDRELFKCPACEENNLTDSNYYLRCPNCGIKWPIEDGLYVFK